MGADGDANADFAGAARHGVGHQSIEADGCEQQREGGEEAGKHRRDAFFDQLSVDGLRNRSCPDHVFVAEGLDLMAYCFLESLRRFLAAFAIRRMPVLESAVIGETVSCQPCRLGMVASPKLT